MLNTNTFNRGDAETQGLSSASLRLCGEMYNNNSCLPLVGPLEPIEPRLVGGTSGTLIPSFSLHQLKYISFGIFTITKPVRIIIECLDFLNADIIF